MNIDSLVIEITRQCNMSCCHCLRGDAQNLDISTKILINFFKALKNAHISSITFTGGEPSLKPDKIALILRLLKKYKISLGYFYIATNAKIVPMSFLKVIMDLYLYSDEKEACTVNYSNSDQHEEVEKNNIELLSIFKFVSPKYQNDSQFNGQYGIMQGRFKDNYGWSEKKLYASPYRIENDYIGEGDIYLNAKGNIVPDCALSYETQDIEKLIVCKIDENFTEEKLIQSCGAYNTRIDTLGVKTIEEIEELEYQNA